MPARLQGNQFAPYFSVAPPRDNLPAVPALPAHLFPPTLASASTVLAPPARIAPTSS